MCVCVEKAADDLHRRRRDSDLEDALFERTEVAAVTEPKDATEYMVRVGWTSGDLVCAVSMVKMRQQRSHCMTLMIRRVEQRQFHETRLGIRMTVWVIVKRRRNRYVYSFSTRHEQTISATATDRLLGRLHNTQSTLRSKRLSFKWMSNDDNGKVAKFAEWSWFRSIAQPKLAEQWKDAHGVGKLKRADEHSFVIRSLTRSARAGRRQARFEKWNLGSVKAVLHRIRELKTSTEIDTSVAR